MADWSTPINKMTRENLRVLIENNKMNESLELSTDFNSMETDSPIRKPYLQPISKKLFHSPMEDQGSKQPYESRRATKKRKRVQDSCELKIAYVKECDRDTYSPEAHAGMRKRVLISLMSNNEYCMDMSF